MGEFLSVLRGNFVEAGVIFRLYPNQVEAMKAMVAEADEEILFRLSILSQLSCSGEGVREAFLEALAARFPKAVHVPWYDRLYHWLMKQ